MPPEMEMQCPNCKDSKRMVKYRGLVPNEGITFFDDAYYFCPECGQIIRFKFNSTEKWDWMQPVRTAKSARNPYQDDEEIYCSWS